MERIINRPNGYLKAHLDDLARAAAKSQRSIFSKFLSPAECILADMAAHSAGVKCFRNGGHQDYERAVCAFGYQQPDDWWFSCLRINWNNGFCTLSHRDILGALMSLGYERECFGDILLEEDTAYFFALNSVCQHVASSLTSAGRAAINIQIIDDYSGIAFQPQGEIIHRSVSSTRLDCLIAAANDISRSKAAQLITSGNAKVMYVEQTRPDAQIAAGWIVSVTGHHRFKLLEIYPENKKRRIPVDLFIYGRK